MDSEQIAVTMTFIKEDGSKMQGIPIQDTKTSTVLKLFQRANTEFNVKLNELEAKIQLVIPDEQHAGRIIIKYFPVNR